MRDDVRMTNKTKTILASLLTLSISTVTFANEEYWKAKCSIKSIQQTFSLKSVKNFKYGLKNCSGGYDENVIEIIYPGKLEWQFLDKIDSKCEKFYQGSDPINNEEAVLCVNGEPLIYEFEYKGNRAEFLNKIATTYGNSIKDLNSYNPFHKEEKSDYKLYEKQSPTVLVTKDFYIQDKPKDKVLRAFFINTILWKNLMAKYDSIVGEESKNEQRNKKEATQEGLKKLK